MTRLLSFALPLLLMPGFCQAQEASQILPNPHGFEMTLWAREPMLRNPVALSFDDRGRLFVVETARRGTVDIDIRAHKDWAYDDLKNQSIAQLRLFFWEKMAPTKSGDNAPWLPDHNQDGSHDYRDLEHYRERIYRIEDRDGDRVADNSQIFYEGFNEDFNGVIAGVFPWQGNVWATVYPDLWQLKDHDDDGVADEIKSAYRGFGVHAAYDGHDIHGLTLGPEGKLYFSVGDNGISVVTLEGRRIHHPNTGGVLRMNPDGSELELFAYGLRNVQEIAFDEYGNLFSVDNDGDIEDERERFVHIVEGSDAGWRLNWQLRTKGWTRTMDQPFYNPWVHERMWIPYFEGQPAHITPPISNYSVGPGGFKYNPGTALNAAYEKTFFLAQFPVQKITAFKTKPRGATFEMVNEHVFHFGMMASAMNFGPDGAMYLADWDGKWQPNERGAVWRLDDPEKARSAERHDVERLLREGFSQRATQELATLLGHRDRRIRQRAQGALAARGALDSFLQHIRNPDSPQLARIHSLWGLIEMRGDGLSASGEQLPFQDADPEIRKQVAKVAGELRLRETSVSLIRLLAPREPAPVRFEAAVALGKLRARNAVPGLLSLLRTNSNVDPYLRHAAVMGLAGSADPIALARLSADSSQAVRLGAVNALRRQSSPLVREFLSDSDAWVRAEAARAIHDDFSIPDALPDLAQHLASPRRDSAEAVIRRAMSANLRLGTREAADRLIQFSLDTQNDTPMRIEAIENLRVWNARPYLDRVTGRARNLGPRDPDLGNQLLTQHALELFEDADPALAGVLTTAIERNQLAVPQEVLWLWLEDDGQTTKVRINALNLLLADGSETVVTRSLKTALSSSVEPLRIAAIKGQARTRPADALAHFENLEQLSLREQQALLAMLPSVEDSQTAPILTTLLGLLAGERLDAALALDVVEASRDHSSPAIQRRLNALPNAADRYALATAGGNPVAGKLVYETHVAAQCVRCHNAGGKGKQVGPVLTGIGERVSAAYLLEALLEPSRTIAPGFQNVMVDLVDGETVDGVILEESEDTLTLGLLSGEVKAIPAAEIDDKTVSQLSAMPSMKDLMTPLEIRDLVAYLQTL